MKVTDATTAYFIGNRLWWSVALLLSPIAGAIAGQPIVAIAVCTLAILPSFVLFDSDRKWWSEEVRDAQRDAARTRSETRKLTVASGTALLIGSAAALLLLWG